MFLGTSTGAFITCTVQCTLYFAIITFIVYMYSYKFTVLYVHMSILSEYVQCRAVQTCMLYMYTL